MIDNYDSFTYNLVDYIGKLTRLPIDVFRHDEVTITQLQDMDIKAIVISPGPKEPKDAGISKAVIEAFSGKIPLFGVCLGHQSIGEVFGGKTVHAKQLMHGKTSKITHTGHALFKGVPSTFVATRYHSLVIEQETCPSVLDIVARADDDGEIMAVVHQMHPTYGVQFHPESICSPDGLKIIENFLRLASCL